MQKPRLILTADESKTVMFAFKQIAKICHHAKKELRDHSQVSLEAKLYQINKQIAFLTAFKNQKGD